MKFKFVGIDNIIEINFDFIKFSKFIREIEPDEDEIVYIPENFTKREIDLFKDLIELYDELIDLEITSKLNKELIIELIMKKFFKNFIKFQEKNKISKLLKYFLLDTLIIDFEEKFIEFNNKKFGKTKTKYFMLLILMNYQIDKIEFRVKITHTYYKDYINGVQANMLISEIIKFYSSLYFLILIIKIF